MNKDDVKTLILIFLILLVVSVSTIFGMEMYQNITEENGDNWEFVFSGNTIISPDKNTNTLKVESGDSKLNQILPAGSANNDINTNENGYYYEQLNSYSKLIYDKIKNNKENIKSGTYRINFGNAFKELLSQENGSNLLQEYYQAAMETFLYDNPDSFYLDATKMYINIQTTKKVFTTTYDVFIDKGNNANYFAEGFDSKEQVVEYEEQIEKEVQKIIEKTSGKNDYGKILTIHDYLVENVSYDQTISKDNIYNMYGALVNKEAVCEGYAKAFKYLLDKVGIKSIIVIGNASDSEGKNQSHAWNYVLLNNKWYGVDVTWDDPIIIGGGKLSQKNKYRYFLKGSVNMAKDHTEMYTFVENGKEYEHPVLDENDY